MKRWLVRWHKPAQQPGDQTEFAITIETEDAARAAYDYIARQDGWSIVEFTEQG